MGRLKEEADSGTSVSPDAPSFTPALAPAPLVCELCGTQPGPEATSAARLAWSRSVERGRTVWTCERCSRDHVRSIEAKLDAAWW